MSNIFKTLPGGGGGGAVVETLTGNNTTVIVPPAGNNINIVGTGNVLVTGNAGTSTLTISDVAAPVLTLTAFSGANPVSPTTGGTINVLGTGSITTVATANTVTAELTGLTINSILYGLGTATVGLVTPVDNAVLTTGTSGVPVLTALSANGQLLIGSASGIPLAANLTAGSGISITNAANSITIAANDFAINYTNVTHAMSPYTVLTTDYYLSVDCSGGVVSLLFPNAPTFKQRWIVKDRTGSASTNNISVTTVGGTVTIDGQTTYTIASNFGSIELLANATPTYEVF
jgi:hypothetical protein